MFRCMIWCMTSPKRTSRQLTKAPLVHVLTQVRFAPVLSIGQAIPRIQERLKEIGFLRFEKSKIQNIVFAGQTPKVESQERWDFTDREKQSGVVLTQDFVILQTSQYTNFDAFSEIFGKVLQIISADGGAELA